MKNVYLVIACFAIVTSLCTFAKNGPVNATQDQQTQNRQAELERNLHRYEERQNNIRRAYLNAVPARTMRTNSGSPIPEQEQVEQIVQPVQQAVVYEI